MSLSVTPVLRTFLSGTAICLVLWSQPLLAQDSTPDTAAYATALDGAELIGTGRISAWQAKGRVVFEIPAAAVGQEFLWYVEVVGVPAGVVAHELEAASILARLERDGDSILIRDLTTKASSLAGPGETTPEDPVPGTDPMGDVPAGDGGAGPFEQSDPKVDPIQVAINLLETGRVLAAFPVLGEGPDGSVLIDVTDTFRSDIGGLGLGKFVALTGQVPAGVDPSRSSIARVRVGEDSVNIRANLTFVAANPSDPAAGASPVSLVVGHSILFLPKEQMAPRYHDPRVGFFTTDYRQFETGEGNTVASQSVISRFRLVKADPTAAVSDPIEPITYWIGPGVPDRWRPYIREGILSWNAAFEAAGISNAIVAKDAPSVKEDPDWLVEDVTRNVVRWVPLDFANAMGPHVVDPRSGETLSAHILIWPKVLEWFSLYYYAVFGTVDPEASTLPLSTEKQGELLAYIVAHEIGHTLGLRHNQIASTAWSVDQMRDPAFANVHGPNSSVMAYGRFNQVAQPGDGVTQFFSVLGPYDYAAIKWGYGNFASQADLDAFAATFDRDRALNFGSVEGLDGTVKHFFDPRSQTENTGAERIEATRLGVANTLRSLDHLGAAVGDNDELYAAAYDMILSIQLNFVNSVARMIAGTMPQFGDGTGARLLLVPAEEQRAAVNYVLGEGAQSFVAFQNPEVVERVAVFGGYRRIDNAQADLVGALLSPDKIGLLERQSVIYQGAYSAVDLGTDVAAAIWDDLGTDLAAAVLGDYGNVDYTTRSLQRAWINTHQALITGWAGAATAEPAARRAAMAMGIPAASAAVLTETGDDTLYPAWLRDMLPDLKTRIDAAVTSARNDSVRLHFEEMSVEVGHLITMMQ
ncbi:MAG: zinc-dependent metalloprotease [Rhodobacterales bacterium]|nr:zinc-dependent metalloprotease [Rhodobacterales bacterium]